MKDFCDVGRASVEALAVVSKAELDTVECKSGGREERQKETAMWEINENFVTAWSV